MNKLGWKFTSHHVLNAWFHSKRIQKKLNGQAFDLIVVGAGEAELIAYLKTETPVMYVADTTFRNMVNYYPWHTGLCKMALRQGDRVERNAIQNATHLIYSSSWAAQSAVNDYGASPERISLLSFGANLLQIPHKKDLNTGRPGSSCNLLFLGVQWERKGGPIAHETFIELKQRGVDCKLTVVGCNPALEKEEGLHIIPFLDKNDPAQAEELAALLMEADFLLVPTRADCTPVVFSEAAAFGVPVITSLTGGTGSVIKNGRNGFCLSMEARGKAYADLIEELWLNKENYRQLRLDSRAEYDERLNWSVWIEKFNALLKNSNP